MSGLSLTDVLRWTGARLAWPPAQPSRLIFRSLSTDTRSVGPGDLFLALRGRQFDAHDFLSHALAAGATGIIAETTAPAVDELLMDPAMTEPGAPPILLVSDTLHALQQIAAGYRQTLPGTVIGITGSVGKTSTRQMVAACLQTRMQVHQTRGNFNNEIGLPQTLLQAAADDQAIILEMGMRGSGEIDLLSRVAAPDLAVITNIGISHIERLGSQQAILTAKAEIINGLKPDGLLLLNGDDPMLRTLGRRLAGSRRVGFVTTDPALADSLPGCLLLLGTQIQAVDQQTRFTARLLLSDRATADLKVDVPVLLTQPGRHHVQNALLGLAVACELGLPLAAAAAGASQYENTGNRQRLIKVGGMLVMDDSYNASPESMLAALRTLSGLAGDNRLLAALGGMLELGSHSHAAHRMVGDAAARAGYQRILALGPSAADIASGAHAVDPDLPVDCFDSQAHLITALLAALKPGDHILVKGSRGYAMEKVTEAILAAAGQGSAPANINQVSAKEIEHAH
jgi:UDP-N-acetylmuramoyl-tripeptide--D-alanyl-D-alanine ligase